MARHGDLVDEELRGWNWGRAPLKPRAYFELGVSEVSYRLCPTRRDLWLRRRDGVKIEPSEAMRIGAAIHNIIHSISSEISRLSTKGLKIWDAYTAVYRRIDRMVREYTQNLANTEWLYSFAQATAFTLASIAAELGLPLITEFTVDGSLLGLSKNLRIDALFQGAAVVEFKYGYNRDDYQLALTGYALALESFLELPIDTGIAVLIANGCSELRTRVEAVYISNNLRQEFIEARDEAIDVLLSPSPPPKPSQCPQTCPYRRVCGAPA